MKGVVILGFLLAACYVGGSLGHRDLTSMEAAEEAAEEAMEVAVAAEEAEEEEEAGGARGMTGRQIGGGRFQTRREAQRQVRARVAAVNVARFVSFLLRLDRDRTRALVVNFLQALANAAAPPTTPILAVTTPILAVTTPTAAQSPAPTTGPAVEGSSTPPNSADSTTPTPVQDAEVVRELRTLLDELQES